MKFLDLLRMSSTSLLKRKVRTILTVLGVTIGVASIVVMVSLGLGLNKSSLEEMESYGSLTAITVYEPGSYYDPSMDGSADSQEEKRLDDALVESIRQLPHVEMVSPMLNMSILARCGIYEGNLYIQAMSAEAFEAMKIPVGEGHYPDGKDGKLEFFYGNMALQSFYVASTGSYPYYERNELPDIDLMEDPIFYIFDMDAYYQSRYKSSGDGSGTTVAPPRRYMIDTAGIVAGGEEEWNSFSYNVYCEIESLKTELKRIFKNKAIPGQPTTKSGKPYSRFVYTSAKLQADDMENVEASAGYLMQGNIPYEFRTTVVREFHKRDDFEAIGRWLAGAEKYYLQAFEDSGDLIRPGLRAYTKEIMDQALDIVRRYVPNAELRGI